jgi:3-oxoadipate enol-lactonase
VTRPDIVGVVPLVEVNGAQLWVEESGDGPAVLFVHGGLGDLSLWEPQAGALSARFRCVRFDLRFFGRSTGPGTEWSSVDDVVGLLDALGIEQAALLGLSMGGGVALDVALAYPHRVWALAHVAGAVSGLPVRPVHRRAGGGLRGRYRSR